MPYHTEYLHRNKIKFTALERISNCSFTYLHILLKILKQDDLAINVLEYCQQLVIKKGLIHW